MASILVGPLLRYVDSTSATVWVEVDRPCTVEILGRRVPTFAVAGHHFALVVLERLEPGVRYPLVLRLDGAVAWPAAGTPGAVLVTPAGELPLRFVVGSCRVGGAVVADDAGADGERIARLETDALAELGRRAQADPATAPALLILAGDQMYADLPSPATLEFLRSRRPVEGLHAAEVIDFEEYAFAYREAWTADPAVQWLLATVPTVMIFDDHDVHDGWNSSQAWVDGMRAEPEWAERIVAAFASYWVYQHLGNLSPADLRRDPLTAAALAGDDISGPLFDLAQRSAGLVEGERPCWHFLRDVGGVRLVVVDARSDRVLTEGARSMLSPAGWSWLDERLTGGCEHLVVVSSVPVVLPHMVQWLEAWADRTSAGAWGGPGRVLAELARDRLGLEHWPAYGDSAGRLLDMLADVAAGRRGTPPSSVVVVSGEVHYGYLAAIDVPGEVPVVQLVSSPLRNPSSRPLRVLHRFSTTRPAALLAATVARLAAVPRPRHRWRLTAGPWFRNLAVTLEFGRRDTQVTVERTLPPSLGQGLEVVHDVPLASGAAAYSSRSRWLRNSSTNTR